MFEIKGKFNTAKVFTDKCDKTSIEQIENLLNQSWIENSKIRIMPDVHAGKDCTIGLTMTLNGKVCPNLVGVDIGCGMLTVALPEEIDLSIDKLVELDNFINNNIPSGFSVNGNCTAENEKKIESLLSNLSCRKYLKNEDHIFKSLGTLGGGNHFIEIDKHEISGICFLVIHSGSRNLGAQVAKHYQDFAQNKNVQKRKKEQIEKIIGNLKRNNKEAQIEEALRVFHEEYEDEILLDTMHFLEKEDYLDYLKDVKICQKYADLNRLEMGKLILEFLLKKHIYCNKNRSNDGVFISDQKGESIYYFTTIHNYIDSESNILRKGSIRALDGEKVLIPINMRGGSIIGIGMGNADYNYSAPHGAGRNFSRTEAKNSFTLDEFKNSMEGIYSTSVSTNTIDESPMAYKDIKNILSNTEDTVEIVSIIKPIYNFKAH